LFRDEADMPPYHYDLHEASKRLGRSVPKIERVLNELNSIGYRSVKTHFKGTAIKTEADYNEFLDVLRGL
jgi:tRNA (guanine26-N2/guanine27-N2)-dimethyltransferase